MNRPYPRTQCCPRCTDYGFDDWYLLFCGFTEKNVGIANRTTISGNTYYWVNSFESALNGLLLNFAWSLEQRGSSWVEYVDLELTSIDEQSLDLKVLKPSSFPFVPDPTDPADYDDWNVTLSDFWLRMRLQDTCGYVVDGKPAGSGQNYRHLEYHLIATANWSTPYTGGEVSIPGAYGVTSPAVPYQFTMGNGSLVGKLLILRNSNLVFKPTYAEDLITVGCGDVIVPANTYGLAVVSNFGDGSRSFQFPLNFGTATLSHDPGAAC